MGMSLNVGNYFDLKKHEGHYIACIEMVGHMEIRCMACKEMLISFSEPDLLETLIFVLEDYIINVLNRDTSKSFIVAPTNSLFRVVYNDVNQTVVPASEKDLFFQLSPNFKDRQYKLHSFRGQEYLLFLDFD